MGSTWLILPCFPPTWLPTNSNITFIGRSSANIYHSLFDRFQNVRMTWRILVTLGNKDDFG